jgi:hypothetical protein
MLAVLITASLSGAALGLLISTVSPTTEAAIAFLPVVLLPFILLGGGIKPVHEMPKTAQVIAAVTPTRWAYEVNLLQEARERQSTFKNELERKLLECQHAVTQCQAAASPAAGAPRQATTAPAAPAVQTDIAAGAFPISNGRSTLRRSFQMLGTFFAIFVILILSTLTLKSPR